MAGFTVCGRAVSTRNRTLVSYLKGAPRAGVIVERQEALSHTLLLSYLVEGDELALEALCDLAEENGHYLRRASIRAECEEPRKVYARWCADPEKRPIALAFLRAAKRAGLWLLPVPRK